MRSKREQDQRRLPGELSLLFSTLKLVRFPHSLAVTLHSFTFFVAHPTRSILLSNFYFSKRDSAETSLYAHAPSKAARFASTNPPAMTENRSQFGKSSSGTRAKM